MTTRHALTQTARRRAGRAALLAPLLACALLVGCNADPPPATVPAREAAPAAAAETARPVRVITAERGALTASRTAAAAIAAARESRVASGANGRVARVLVREGERVEAGQSVIELESDNLLAQLRNAELAAETARVNLAKAERASAGSREQVLLQVEAAEANAASARRQVEEGRALLATGGIARADLQLLEAQLAQAESALAQAREGLASLDRAGQEDLALLRLQVEQADNAVRQARDALNEAAIKAPFAGEVAEVYVEAGEFVGAGSPAFRLRSATERVATLDLPPEDAEQLLALGTIELQRAGRAVPARIVRSGQAQGQRLTTLTAELAAGEHPLPPGSSARVEYEIELASGVLLPSGALTVDAGTSYAYVVENGRAVRRAVTVLAESGGRAAVNGVEAGEQVISPLPVDVRDGTKVELLGD